MRRILAVAPSRHVCLVVPHSRTAPDRRHGSACRMLHAAGFGRSLPHGLSPCGLRARPPCRLDSWSADCAPAWKRMLKCISVPRVRWWWRWRRRRRRWRWCYGGGGGGGGGCGGGGVMVVVVVVAVVVMAETMYPRISDADGDLLHRRAKRSTRASSSSSRTSSRQAPTAQHPPPP